MVSSLGNISSVSSSEEPAALSAYQYFENIRNFSVAADDIGLPKFEACDVEKVGSNLNSVLCKSNSILIVFPFERAQTAPKWSLVYLR